MIDSLLTQPIAFEDLAQFKRLDALSAELLAKLAKLEKLDIAGFSEQEVRSYFIDPIVEVLGYDKGTDFSADLGKAVEFLGKKKFPDYKFNLWKENFWLIEAKRPLLPERASFGYDDLAQAVEYAIHPNINAALVVLCDGSIIEVFDREVSLTEPVLHLDKANLVRAFDRLRLLLEPMQVWFFQKRRNVRLIDKVFDKEFNLNRVEEFRSLIERRLSAKRPIVLENFRRNVGSDHEAEKAHLRAAPLEELVSVHLYFELSHPSHNALIDGLIARSQPASFHALHQVFPDLPRDISDTYMAQGLMYLMALYDKKIPVHWLPSWLARGPQDGQSLEQAIKHLLRWNLTYFDGDEARRTILLANNAFRRVIKLLLVSDEKQWRLGEVLHFLSRYETPELTWRQIVSSPEGHLIGLMDARTMFATERFVRGHRAERNEFMIESAKRQLKEIWKLEKTLLGSIGDYPSLNRERSLGSMRIIEWASVSYDVLGHTTLCLLPRYKAWLDFALQEHLPQIKELAAMGSWQARKLLGIEQHQKVEPLPDQQIADRFFFGDVEILLALKTGYSAKK